MHRYAKEYRRSQYNSVWIRYGAAFGVKKNISTQSFFARVKKIAKKTVELGAATESTKNPSVVLFWAVPFGPEHEHRRQATPASAPATGPAACSFWIMLPSEPRVTKHGVPKKRGRETGKKLRSKNVGNL